MSGISGIVSPGCSDTPASAERVARMHYAMRHRGPGAADIWSGAGVVLGQQRANGESPGQSLPPATSPDAASRLVLDGRVQHPADAPSLDGLLRRFLTAGVTAFRGIRGEYALAVWQCSERRMTLVRDPLGIKPLYYAHRPDGTLFFASEPKALLASGAVPAALDFTALSSYLANHGASGEATLFEGIRRVPPGHALIWQDGQIRLECYWNLSGMGDSAAAMAESEVAERFNDLLREVSASMLQAGATTGAFLSGSVGSAALVSVLSDVAGPGIRTYSIAFAGEPTDQRRLARRAAWANGTDHTEVALSASDFFSVLPDTIWYQDEPVADPAAIPLYHAALHAAGDVEGLWSAVGCDELFGSHPRYRSAETAARMARGLHAGLALSGVRNGVRRTAEAMGRHSRLARRFARRLPHAPIDILRLYLDELAVFGAADQMDLLTDEAREQGASPDPHCTILDTLERDGAGDMLDQIVAAGFRVSLPVVAVTHDRITAAASIDGHAPFLDHEIVRFAARLPARMRLRSRTPHHLVGPSLRRRIPAEILHRPAGEVPVPVGRWLRRPLRPLLHEYVLSDRALGRRVLRPDAVGNLVAEHESRRADHSRKLWALINLEIWQRLYVDGEAGIGDARAPVAAATA